MADGTLWERPELASGGQRDCGRVASAAERISPPPANDPLGSGGALRVAALLAEKDDRRLPAVGG